MKRVKKENGIHEKLALVVLVSGLAFSMFMLFSDNSFQKNSGNSIQKTGRVAAPSDSPAPIYPPIGSWEFGSVPAPNALHISDMSGTSQPGIFYYTSAIPGIRGRGRRFASSYSDTQPHRIEIPNTLFSNREGFTVAAWINPVRDPLPALPYTWMGRGQAVVFNLLSEGASPIVCKEINTPSYDGGNAEHGQELWDGITGRGFCFYYRPIDSKVIFRLSTDEGNGQCEVPVGDKLSNREQPWPWLNVVAEYDPQDPMERMQPTMKVFVNGEKKATCVHPSGGYLVEDSNVQAFIGARKVTLTDALRESMRPSKGDTVDPILRYAWPSGEYDVFRGSIDEVALYDAPLPEDKIGNKFNELVAITGCPRCRSDINRDGVVTILDFSLFVTCMNQHTTATVGGVACANSDSNRDGYVTVLDFSCLAANFNRKLNKASITETHTRYPNACEYDPTTYQRLCPTSAPCR